VRSSEDIAALTPSSQGELAPDELRRKMTWLTVFRTVASSLLLAAIAARLLTRPVQELSTADSFSFAIIATAYFLTVIYGVLIRGGKVGRRAAYLQVLGDLLLASGVVFLTGGIESPFTFTYSIAVVAASILLSQRGAQVAALGATLSFSVMAVAIERGLLVPPGVSSVSTAQIIFSVSGNALAQALIAALASYLSRQLTAAGGRLSEREANLRELVGLQNQIVAAMPSGLITCEGDGRITFINPAAAQILGIDAGRTQLHVENLLPEVLQLRPVARRAELTVRTDTGNRVLGLAVTPLEGARDSMLIVFQDLTDLRLMEDELRRIDKMASLGKLSAQLAHEIRNPLAAMRGSAQMLASEAGPAGTRLAGILIRESDRLSGLVEDFLRFARPPPPNLISVRLDELVAETVEMLRGDPLTRSVDLALDLDETTVELDPGQIRQVLLNLARNALEAVKNKGRVKISLTAMAETAELSVWDSAGSIPLAELGRIFEPFFSTKEGGTGLGLSTAHSIVQSHAGRIRVSSSPQKGTEFVIILPRAEVRVADSGRR
jgi:two-component system sensor histidine kinase PilS (NtrC family)